MSQTVEDVDAMRRRSKLKDVLSRVFDPARQSIGAPQSPSTPPFVSRNTMDVRTGESNPAYQAIRGIQSPSPALQQSSQQIRQVDADVPTNAAMGEPPAPPVLSPRTYDGVRRAVSQPLEGKSEGMGQRVMPSDLAQQEPLDEIEQKEARLRELESKPVGFWKRLGTGLLSRALTRRGDETPVEITKRDRDIGQARRDLGRSLELEKRRPKDRNEQLTTRVVGPDEYPDIEAGTVIRQRVNQRTNQLEDIVQNGRPVIAELPKAESEGSLRTEGGYLVRVRGNKATRVIGEDGQPIQAKEDEKGDYTLTINGQRIPNVTRKELLDYYKNQATQEGIKSRFDINEANEESRFQRTLEDRNKPKVSELPAGIKEDIAKGHGELPTFKQELTAIDEKIKAANALPAGLAKDEELATLGRKRERAVTKIRQRMATLNQLDPENEWGVGTKEEGFYPYNKPKAGAAPSDADRSIYPNATVDPLKGQKWYKSRYKGKLPVDEAAKKAAARGAIVVP